MEPIRTTADLYAHALALEEEAAHRYVEFAVRMLDEGNGALADLFWKLGRAEGEHYAALLRLAGAQDVRLAPADARKFRWIDPAHEPAAQQLAFRLMTPRRALAIALDAERRARDFFNAVARGAADPAVRSVARDLAAEETGHIALLLQEMERAPAEPATATEWERLFVEAAA